MKELNEKEFQITLNKLKELNEKLFKKGIDDKKLEELSLEIRATVNEFFDIIKETEFMDDLWLKIQDIKHFLKRGIEVKVEGKTAVDTSFTIKKMYLTKVLRIIIGSMSNHACAYCSKPYYYRWEDNVIILTRHNTFVESGKMKGIVCLECRDEHEGARFVGIDL